MIRWQLARYCYFAHSYIDVCFAHIIWQYGAVHSDCYTLTNPKIAPQEWNMSPVAGSAGRVYKDTEKNTGWVLAKHKAYNL